MNLDLPAKPAAFAISVAAFVAAALYIVIESPDGAETINRTAIETQPMSNDGSKNKAASVTSLVGGLEAKLAQNPNHAKGWLLLAKSHDHLGDQRAAWIAYSRAKELGMSDASFEIELAANISQHLP
jgi:cytochrome c-type biogenesis protein CcmH/NrfG